MSLPNPGMDFDPFDVLPAAQLDDLVENIEALADGSGANDPWSPPGNIEIVTTKGINDVDGNEFIKFSKTASAVNELTVKNQIANSDPEIQATGGDTNIGINLVPKGTEYIRKSGNPIDWYEEIGRTTLGSAGDTITVSGLPARKYLRIIADCRQTGGTISMTVTFNGDGGTNYSSRVSVDGGADATSTSSAGLSLSASTNQNHKFFVIDILNEPTTEKLVMALSTQAGAAGASNAPSRKEFFGKWANTSVAISSITVTNGGTGDYAIGSEVVVLGHD